ncbi:hypothetical protein LCGC14_2445880 [marine sediment metagenome]|uniref:Uncharacterized protein n=1 Tax=marine sediment metagenome TaxID=412755 RepID=A0A0F9BHU2_9ZZZZ
MKVKVVLFIIVLIIMFVLWNIAMNECLEAGFSELYCIMSVG